jgi:hypothetical protein
MSNRHRVSASRWTIVPVALCCTVSGCASSAPVSTPSGSVSSPSAATAAPQGRSRVDACSMVSPQEISSLLGVSVAGVSTGKDPGRGDCSWTNASTDESVSLRIGNSGTALNDTLPAAEPGFPDPTTPGPDGMRYLGNGGVKFAAGGRVNTVQVAVLRLSADQANAAAVTLVRAIAPQVPK